MGFKHESYNKIFLFIHSDMSIWLLTLNFFISRILDNPMNRRNQKSDDMYY